MSLRAKLRALFTLGQGVTRGLPEASADRDPIELFGEWFAAARRSGLLLPEAMTVATATPAGVPSARMMLLKGVDQRGFVFFTNFESRKGEELSANPRAALVFHWAVLQRQVRVEGPVVRLGADESGEYFATRPWGARVGAWASAQSRPLPDRGTLEDRVREVERRYGSGDIPLPPFWGGFRLTPVRIEFWQGRANRLHDRLVFTRDGDAWTVGRLYP